MDAFSIIQNKRVKSFPEKNKENKQALGKNKALRLLLKKIIKAINLYPSKRGWEGGIIIA